MVTQTRKNIGLTWPHHLVRSTQLAMDLAQAERTRERPDLPRLTSGEFTARAWLHARSVPHWWIFGSAFRPGASDGSPSSTLPARWPIALHQVVDEDLAQINAVSEQLLDGFRARRSTYLRASISWTATQIRQGDIGSWILDDTPLDQLGAACSRLDLYLAQIAN